jgi:hypothetical protein
VRFDNSSVSAKVTVILVGAWLLAGCRADRWRGFVYPGGETLASIELGEFDTLDTCRSAARHRLSTIEYGGTYECGKNCRAEEPAVLPDMPLYICEETVE